MDCNNDDGQPKERGAIRKRLTLCLLSLSYKVASEALRSVTSANFVVLLYIFPSMPVILAGFTLGVELLCKHDFFSRIRRK